MRAARQNLRKVWSDKARAAALAARRGQPTGGGSMPGETVDQATARANAYIAAHPNDFLPKGTKKPKAAKGKTGKAKDPKAEAAKAKEKADRAAEHAQRQKEHTEDRAQRQADRETRAKEHAQSQAEHAQSRAEHEADRATRQKQQAERAKQQAAKAKGKASASGSKKSGGTRGTGQMDAKTQAADVKQERLNTAAASRVGAALASGGKVNSGDAARLVGAGLARQNGADLELTPQGQSLLSQKMAKRVRARAWEAEMLTKVESDYSPATRAKRKAYDNARPNKHPGKTAQRQAVRASIARGDRAPASTRKCAYCGKQADQYHHTNYTRKSGNVKPICASCNTRLSHQDEARKLAKRRHARAWEAEMLTKAELPNLAQNAHQSLRKYL